MRDRLYSALSVPDEIDLTALEKKITFFSNRKKNDMADGGLVTFACSIAK